MAEEEKEFSDAENLDDLTQDELLEKIPAVTSPEQLIMVLEKIDMIRLSPSQSESGFHLVNLVKEFLGGYQYFRANNPAWTPGRALERAMDSVDDISYEPVVEKVKEFLQKEHNEEVRKIEEEK